MKMEILKRTAYVYLCLLCVLTGCKDKELVQYKGPHVEFKSKEFDLGTIPQNGEFAFSFEFINNGDALLTILSVKASCGCTVLDGKNQEVAPASTGKISGKFYSRQYKGKLVRTITVTTNDPANSQITLYINSIVEGGAGIE